MKKSEFLKIIKSIEPSRHVVAGRRGSEENVKIKIVLPLLQFLGYDIVRHLDFERLSADIVVVDEQFKPILIVETKAWEEQIKRHLNQCLEYTFKIKTPFIIITSGQHTALYSSLGNLDNLNEVEPIMEFNLNDLLGKNGKNILSKLYLLVSKDSLLSGAGELNKAVMALLPKNKNIKEARKEFLKKCEDFKTSIKTVKITDDDFTELANNYPEEVYNALMLAKDEFYKISQGNNNVRIRYRSKSIGLEYLHSTGPRPKLIGLVEINPSGGWIAFGMEGWTKLLSSTEIVKRLKDFPKTVKNEKQIRKLVKLIKDGLEDIVL